MNKQIDKLLSKATSVALVAHINPDGDAYGSLSASYKYIKSKFGCEVDCFAETNNIADEFANIVKEINFNVEPRNNYSVCIVLDSADKTRLGKFVSVFDSSETTICIDHHITNIGYADINIIREISSNCELIYHLLKDNKFKFDKEIMSRLYVGMLTDTNNFTTSLVNENTYLALADFARVGVNITELYKLFYSNSLVQFKLLAFAMNSVQMYNDNTIMVMQITKSQMNKVGATKEDLNGIINQAFNIRKCLSALLITPRDDKMHCSLRCKQGIDVSSVATVYGGGGHKEASAFKVDKFTKNMLNDIIASLTLQISKLPTDNKQWF